MERRLWTAAAAVVAISVVACGGVPEQDEPAPPPMRTVLTVISDGAGDALVLEWEGGPADATSWQYRTRTWANYRPQDWSPWQDVPGSNGATRGHRLTGLSAETAYDVQVRALAGDGPAAPSIIGESSTPREHSPELGPWLVEGDGETSWWILGRTVVIPDGMRLRMGPGFIDGPCYGDGGTSVREETSGSFLYVCYDLICETGRSIGPDGEAADALFDRLGLFQCPRELPPPNRGQTLGLAAAGIAAIAVYAVAVWWILRRDDQSR